jgi:hypothetical protein
MLHRRSASSFGLTRSAHAVGLVHRQAKPPGGGRRSATGGFPPTGPRLSTRPDPLARRPDRSPTCQNSRSRNVVATRGAATRRDMLSLPCHYAINHSRVGFFSRRRHTREVARTRGIGFQPVIPFRNALRRRVLLLENAEKHGWPDHLVVGSRSDRKPHRPRTTTKATHASKSFSPDERVANKNWTRLCVRFALRGEPTL